MTPIFDSALYATRPSSPGLSIQGYMLLLIASIMLPMLALVATIAWDYGTAARRTIEAERLDVANNMKFMIDREIDQTEGFLDGISNAPALRGSDDAAVVSHIATMARNRGFETLLVHDLAGHLTLAPAPSPSPVSPDRIGLAEIAAGRKVFVSNLIADESRRPGLYYVSVPIVADGGTVAMLSGGLPPARLQRLFAEAGLRDGWSAGIVDRDGALLARSKQAEKYVGMLAQKPMVDVARGAKNAGLFDIVDRDGIQVKNAYERSAASGWSAGVAVPAVIVDAPLWRTALIMMAIGGCFSVLSLALALLVASNLSRAIRRLGIAAVAVAGGDVVKMPDSNITELQDASRSLEITGALARRRGAMGSD
jgi:HAMP domain-containing protein